MGRYMYGESFVRNLWHLVPAIAGFSFVLIVHGAIPWIAMPTLGQAVWSMGFAASFAEGQIHTIHATHFGIPSPAPISFGLIGAYTASLFIRLGMHPADAYSTMMFFWIGVAYVGAARLANRLGLRSMLSWLAGVLWLSVPIVWAHSTYSLLLLGIALLPAYFFAVLNLLPNHDECRPRSGRLVVGIIFYLLVFITAILMDGYTFVMLAVGSTVLLFFVMVGQREHRGYLIYIVVPSHIAAVGLAYSVYQIYMMGTTFSVHDMDFFRGMGVDLLYWLLPSQGVHWVWDSIGISVTRSTTRHFGDFSVWETTFIIPLVLAGLWGGARAWKTKRLVFGFLAVFVLAFYMALGPSLKVNSVKPEPMGRNMPVELGVILTGSGVLSAHVPGFRSMRATYRWTALGAFALWCLFVLGVAALRTSGERRQGFIAFLVLIALFLPNLGEKWERDRQSRDQFFRIDRDLVEPLRGDVSSGEIVAILPYENDFLANYLAPTLNVLTYNVGGDKNLELARRHWPPTMSMFSMKHVDPGFLHRVLLLLARGEADAVVLPHFGMLEGAHAWPPQETRYEYDWAFLEELYDRDVVMFHRREYYSIVRLSETLRSRVGQSALEWQLLSEFCRVEYPIRIENRECLWEFTIGDGWHRYESRHIWSTSTADLILYPPSQCEWRDCEIRFELYAFGASVDRPVTVHFDLNVGGRVIRYERVFNDERQQQVELGAGVGAYPVHLRIHVPDARAPAEIRDSLDRRVLGVALFELDITPRGEHGGGDH